MTRLFLRWLERGLLGVGVVLAAWCVWVVMGWQATQNMPIPPPSVPVAQTPSVESPSLLPPPPPAKPPAPGAWLARLDAPSVNMMATVLEGSDDRTLRRGAGHLEDTPLPGQPGNIGIAGHRDTVFRPLRGVKVGDALTLTTADREYHYRISRTLIVGPDDVYVLDRTTEPTLTLVTCYPFAFIGRAPKRFIVQADLIDDQARTNQ